MLRGILRAMVGRVLSLFSAGMVIAAIGCTSGDVLECTYVARESEEHPIPYDQELQPRGPCAIVANDGSITVGQEHLEHLHFTDGLADILLPTGWIYVAPDGRSAPVLSLDNGPDPFEEGLARTIRDGKVGFIDRDLSEMIAPRWDFAFPFASGLAVVCEGCRNRPVDEEHTEMYGGVWGYIDQTGKVVVPVVHERDDLPARPTGVIQQAPGAKSTGIE